MFDFNDYTYSGLISIFAALLGMAYPLILQCVQRVDDQYHSACLTEYVRRLIPMRVFQFSLVCNVILAVLCPFFINYLHDGSMAIVVLAIQSIAVLVLMLSLIYLAQLMLKIYSVPSFLELLKHNVDTDANVMEIFEIAQYSATPERVDLHIEAYGEVLKRLNHILDHNEELPQEYVSVIRRLIFNASENEPTKRNLFYYNSDICGVLMNAYGDRYISSNTYHYIRAFLNKVVACENRQWFMGFVDSAYNYKTYRLNLYKDVSSETWKNADAEFQHFMTWVGGLLVYKKRFDWLQDLMYYANEEPAKYVVQLNSLNAICDEACWLQKKCDSGLYLQNWAMDGMSKAISFNEDVYQQMHLYLAWEYIRLFTISEYANNWDNPLSSPSFFEYDYAQYSLCRVSMGRLLRSVEILLDSSDRNKLFTEMILAKETALQPLQEILQEVENKITEKDNNPTLSDSKVQQFKQELISTIQRDVVDLPFVDSVPDNMVEIESTRMMHDGFLIPKAELSEEKPNYIYGLAESMIIRVNQSVRNYYYSKNFLLLPSVKATQLYYYRFIDCLNTLHLSDEYTVFFSRIDDPHVGSYRARQINSVERSAIIMKTKDVPCVIMKDTVHHVELHTIDETSKLYSNIDDLEEKENGYVVYAARFMQFFHLMNHKFIRILVSLDENEDAGSLLIRSDLKLLD